MLLLSSVTTWAMMPGSGVIDQQPVRAAGIILKLRHIDSPTAIANAGGHQPLSAQAVEEMKVVAATELSYKRTASLGTHVLNFPAPMSMDEAEAIAERLQLMDAVEYATPNFILKPMLDPNDPRFLSGEQWALNGTIAGARLPQAWDCLLYTSPSPRD